MTRQSKGPYRNRRDWIGVGGKPNEVAYCQRCGHGLQMGTPIDLSVFSAALKAFIKVHSHCQEGQYTEPPISSPDDWAIGRDTGVSSFTIFSAVTGKPTRYHTYDVPHDPDDFGRCYRLLKLFPTWRNYLISTMTLCKKWQPFVEHWDELTQLYEEELSNGIAPKLYSRIKALESRNE